jgi:hypothetical protein
MKTILAITAAIFAASPALAINWADRTWGAKTCDLLRAGYGKTEAIRVAGDLVGYSVVSASTPKQSALYVVNNCLSAYMNAPDY